MLNRNSNISEISSHFCHFLILYHNDCCILAPIFFQLWSQVINTSAASRLDNTMTMFGIVWSLVMSTILNKSPISSCNWANSSSGISKSTGISMEMTPLLLIYREIKLCCYKRCFSITSCQLYTTSRHLSKKIRVVGCIDHDKCLW